MNAFSPVQSSLLSELDWRVVDMARNDGPRSFNPDGFVAHLLRGFFGIRVARPLTNDKLEALRRFSVRVWFWDVIRSSDLEALLDAGYSREDVLEILVRVASVRGFTPSIEDNQIEHRSPALAAASRKASRHALTERHCG